MRRFGNLLILFVAALALSACGGDSGGSSGGGTGNSGSGGTPVSSSTVNVNKTSLTFTSEQFKALPDNQSFTISVSGSAQGVAIGFPPGIAQPGWLGVTAPDLVNNSTRAEVSILTNTISFGNYSVPLRVASLDSAGNAIDFVDVTINYNLAEGVRLRSNISEITVNMVPMQASITRTITLTGDDISWERQLGGFASEHRVTVNPSSGTIPTGGSQNVDITIEAQGSGISSTTFVPVDFINVDGSPNGTSVQVRMNSIDGLISTPAKIDIILQEGASEVQVREIVLDTFQNNSVTEVTWDASVSESWLSIDNTSGAFSPIDESTHPRINVSVDPSGLEVGSYSDVIRITHSKSVQILQVPVNLTITSPMMKVSSKGVALSNLSDLAGTVSVTDDDGTAIAWEATSDAAWLNLTPAGSAGTPLSFTADPDAVADGLHHAIVTVTSPQADIANSETIAVGFWKGSDIVDDLKISFSSSDELSGGNNFVADPIRPYIYVRKGSRHPDIPTLTTYNIYTGESVGTPLELSELGDLDMVVSDDGSALFVFGEQTERIDLGTMEITQFNVSNVSQPIFARVKGQGIIISDLGRMIDAETLSLVGTVLDRSGRVSHRVSQDGSAYCHSFRSSNRSITCYDLTGTGTVGGTITAIKNGFISEDDDVLSAGYDLSNDGQTLYYVLRGPSFTSTLNGISPSDMMTPRFSPTDDAPNEDLIVDKSSDVITVNIGSRSFEVRTFSETGDLIGIKPNGASFNSNSEHFLLDLGDQNRFIVAAVGHTTGLWADLYVMTKP